MTTMTIRAIYRNGVLRPETDLALPENTTVELEITPLLRASGGAASLFGAVPELATVTSEDIERIKRLWDRGVEKEVRLLDGHE